MRLSEQGNVDSSVRARGAVSGAGRDLMQREMNRCRKIDGRGRSKQAAAFRPFPRLQEQNHLFPVGGQIIAMVRREADFNPGGFYD
jgi:hypothetical protein